jgi:hypothetical protein
MLVTAPPHEGFLAGEAELRDRRRLSSSDLLQIRKRPAHWNCRSSVRYVSRWEHPPEAEPAYDAWLGRQSPATQDDILGKTGGRLFRDGRLSVRQFTDRAGTALTLEELRRRETEAWTRAFGTA